MNKFEIKDCTLIVQTTGYQALNLRELKEGVRSCEASSIYHHFYETLLRPSFDDPVYQNDFATWSAHELHDQILAERLGIIDPYEFQDTEALRTYVLDIIDERLSELEYVPWARPGHAFYFSKAITVVFDTGRGIEHPEELEKAISDMSIGSVFFHFIEARRREPLMKDDFTAWLEQGGVTDAKYLEPFRQVGGSILTLSEIKKRLARQLPVQEGGQ